MAAGISSRREPESWVGVLTYWGATLGVGALIGVLSTLAPDTIRGLTFGPAVLTLFVLVILRRIRRHPDRPFLQPIFWWGLMERLFMVFAHIAIGLYFYHGQVDFVGYRGLAIKLLNEMILQGEFYPFDAAWVGDHFVSISGFITVLLVTLIVFVVGSNYVALFLVSASIGLAGAYLFLRAFEITYPEVQGRRFLGATLFLLPSISFWSIILGKDAWFFLFMGWGTYSFARLLRGVDFRSLVGLGVSLAFIFEMRPPVGITMALAIGLALVFRPLAWSGPAAYLRPIQRILLSGLFALLLVGGASVVLFKMGALSISYDTIANLVWEKHRGFAQTEGGSSLPVALLRNEAGAVVSYIPLGLLTLFFRPFLWEAHNAVALMAAVENLFLLGLVIWRWRAVMSALVSATRQPFMLFVLVVFATTSVVLSFEWNLGATIRHRTMVLPYLLMMLAGLPRRRRDRSLIES